MPAAIDTALVTAAKSGDEQAMASLVAESLPLVYNVVGKALQGSPDVDDVVQETMLRVVRGIGSLKDPERFRAWVISIAYRQMQDRGRSMRAAAARGTVLEDVSRWLDPGADFVDSTLFRLYMAGERREANEASRWLSAEDQRVLRLWWQEAAGVLSRADLARALGLSVGHAAVRVHRTRAQLELARTLWRAWHATPPCDGLTAAAEDLAGPSDPRWLRRLGRHVRRCERCVAYERDLVPDEHLLVGASVAPLLVGLISSVGTPGALGTAGAPFAGLWSLLRRAFGYLTAKPVIVGGTAVLGAATALTVAVYYPPYQDDGPAGAAPPAVATSQPASPGGRQSATPAGGFNGVATASYYISPDGSDDNPGSIERPFATISKAASVVRPGQTIALRAGGYRPTQPVEIIVSGTADQRIVLSNYRDEKPVIDAAKLPAGTPYITQRANYWTVQGLEIKNAPGYGYLCRSCRHDTFRLLSLHDNGATGLLLRDADTVGNQVLDSDFYRNHDDAAKGENADGLAIESGSGTGNVVRGCRLYENSDDGLGLHEFASPVTIEGAWSFGNGVNRWGIDGFEGDGYGFKLGGGDPAAPVNHTITDSAAWDNATYGFTESGNRGALTVRNNTAFRNGRTGFAFVYSTSVLRHNLAIDNKRDSDLGDDVDAAGNSWDQPGWSGAVLVSTDPAPALAPRAPDGRLPRTTFLTNAKDSSVGAPMTPRG